MQCRSVHGFLYQDEDRYVRDQGDSSRVQATAEIQRLEARDRNPTYW